MKESSVARLAGESEMRINSGALVVAGNDCMWCSYIRYSSLLR